MKRVRHDVLSKKQNDSLREALQRIVSERGLVQKEVARILGVSQQTVSNFLNGRIGVGTALGVRIAAAVERDPSDFGLTPYTPQTERPPHFVYATVTQASGDAWRVEGTANDRTLPTMAAALSHAGAQGFRVVSANGTHSEFVMERAALERASGTGEDCAHARGDARRGEDPGAPSNAATTATAKGDSDV